MSNVIRVAKDVSFPRDIVTQTVAILAKRRSGKSYTMRRITEQLLEANQQVVIVDPKGDQWGIRSSSDGKSPGFPVVIFGGEHGDVPLESGAGEMVARLVVEDRVSILLDLSQFRKHEVATFMTAFLENLYRLKAQEKYRTPVMVVCDEADAIAPQKPQKGEERMLGAIEDIVRRGGQRGIGCILVTQRSAVLNKNVLTQAEMLIVLRTIAPQDLAAMKAWIDVHGTDEQGKEMMASLPSLPIGDAYFWSPGWPTADGIFKRSRALPITTFDSGATPKPGERKVVPKNLADVDLEALKGQMAETIEKAKADDPKELKKKIVALEGQLRMQKPGSQALLNAEHIQKTVDTAVAVALRKRDKEWEDQIRKANQEISRLGAILHKIANLTGANATTVAASIVSAPAVVSVPTVHMPPAEVARTWTPPFPDGTKDLRPGALRILEAIATRHPLKLTKSQVGLFSKFKISGGSFTSYLSELRKGGYLFEEQGFFSASEAGIERAGVEINAPHDSASVIEMWKKALRPGEVRMLDVLLEDRDWISKIELGARVGSSAAGGSFTSYLSVLRTNGIVEVQGNQVRVSDSLFL